MFMIFFFFYFSYRLGEVWQKFGLYLTKGCLEDHIEDKFNFYFLKIKKKIWV